MIPILHRRDIDWLPNLVGDNTNGLGRLTDCVSAVVTEERNGIYELEIEYPVNGLHFDEISYNSWIKAKANKENEDYQCFRVYKISKPINGVCTIYAEHISYGMAFVNIEADNPIPSFSYCAAQIQAAMDLIHPYTSFDFIVSTDFTNADGGAAFLYDKMRTLRDFLMGEENSIITEYPGGEFKFDNIHVYYYKSRGSNNGVKIQYGKNMLALRQDISDESMINGVLPYWTGGTGGGSWQYIDRNTASGTQPSVIYNDEAVALFGFYQRVVPIDMVGFEIAGEKQWEDTVPVYDATTSPVRDDFKKCADWYFKTHPENLAPKINIDVSFVDLRDTEEYKSLYSLQSVCLCDIVKVEYPEYGINADFKVVKTEFDVLGERYRSITLGSLRKTLN